jgi:hypothetical protein
VTLRAFASWLKRIRWRTVAVPAPRVTLTHGGVIQRREVRYLVTCPDCLWSIELVRRVAPMVRCVRCPVCDGRRWEIAPMGTEEAIR